MSESEPLRIHLPPPENLQRQLDEHSDTATHVVISFTTCIDSDRIILDEDDDATLSDFEDEDHVYEWRFWADHIADWFHQIADILANLKHVTITQSCVCYGRGPPPSVYSCRFPVTALEELFRLRSDTLETLLVGTEDNKHDKFSPEFFGSPQDYERTISAFRGMANFQHAHFGAVTSWIAIPREKVNPERLLYTAVTQSTSLRRVSFDRCSPEESLALVRGLAANESVASLKLALHWRWSPQSDPNFERNMRESLEIILETNTTLSEINISYGLGSKTMLSPGPKATFWLKANRVGRKALVANPDDPALWTKCLVDNKADVQIIFWLLSSNLSVYLPLLQMANANEENEEERHVPKKRKTGSV